jgi:ABC-type phosphate transport system substrate-binding protein
MSLSSRFAKPLIAAFAVAASASASAQDCTTNSAASSTCFHLKGSDTLFDIVTQGINAARAAAVPGATNLFYEGTGSGNAETNMRSNVAGGLPVSGATLTLGTQSIGPMSRNFRPAVIDDLAVGFLAADGTTTGRQGHVSWAPTCQNVIALDAAVVVYKGSGTGSSCKNISFPSFTDSAIPSSAVPRATSNATGLPVAFGDGTAFNSLASTVNYSNLLMVVLAGVDGSGTLQACSSPKRIQAIQDLAGCMGVATVDHIFRRDDNSGTTDTFKDRIMNVASASDPRYPWVGGRFCNGQSIGGINSATPQQGICSVTRTTLCTTDANCATGEVCQFNLNNQDLDPVRRACVASDASHAPTSCTDMLTGRSCQASDNNPNCTQGLVVALTDNDPGSDSITNSIGARVRNDSNGQTIGYAGREAVLAGKGTKGFTMNLTAPSDANVRKEAYLLSRRLFIQNSLVAGQPLGDQPSDTAGLTNGLIGGGPNQLAAEQSFFNWFSQPANNFSIVKSLNFITCGPDANTDPCTLQNNLCAKTPAAAVAGALGAYVPNGSFGAGGTGGAKTIDSQGRVFNGTAAVQVACTGTTLHASGACSGLLSPLANNRPSNSACSQNSDCASNVCFDALGIGVPGQPVSLLCQ